MIEVRCCSDNDFPVLQKTLGDHAMMEHLGGPENLTQIRRRHNRYLEQSAPGDARMFTIRMGTASSIVGTVGFWEKMWCDENIYGAGGWCSPITQSEE